MKQPAIIHLLLCLFTLTASVYAQPPDTVWTYEYNGPFEDWPVSLAVTEAGEFLELIRSDQESFGNATGLLIKLSEDGEELWQQIYPEMQRSGGVIECDNQDLLLVGGGTDSIHFAVRAVRTNAVGDVIWSRPVGRRWELTATDVVQTSDGGFGILAYESILIRIDADGDSLWTNDYGLRSTTYGKLLLEEDQGFLFCASYRSETNVSDWQAWIVRTNADGSVRWRREVGTEWFDHAWDLVSTGDGGCIVVGDTYRDEMNGVIYPFAARVNAFGDTLWTRIYDDTVGTLISCAALEDGNVVFFGTLLDHGRDYCLMKVDGDGNLLSQCRYDRPLDATGVWITTLANDELLVMGQEWSPFTSRDAWLARLESGTAVGGYIHTVYSQSSVLIHPNPFNSQTRISFALGQSGNAEISLFNLEGRRVANLFDGVLSPGYHEIIFYSEILTSGTYFLKVFAPQLNRTFTLVHVK